MRIFEKTYWQLMDAMPVVPPEIGGILGGSPSVICEYKIDTGTGKGCGCSYAPDVEMLNAEIKEWQKRGIAFQGMFHTHFFGVRTLSDGDIAYITAIMQTMPQSLSELHFPVVVLPDREMTSYLAVRSGNEVTIREETVTILTKGER